jgi:hypothetical protein
MVVCGVKRKVVWPAGSQSLAYARFFLPVAFGGKRKMFLTPFFPFFPFSFRKGKIMETLA